MSAGNSAGLAKYNLPGLINGTGIYTTAALTRDTLSNADLVDYRYSNINDVKGSPVDVVSVGTHVLSTWPGTFNAGRYIPGYRILSGTSMASAVTAGALFANKGKIDSSRLVNLNNISYGIIKWVQ